MEVWSLASSSAGNAYLVASDRCRVLVECGLGPRELARALARLGIDMSDLDALLVTHDHADHLRGARHLATHYEIPLWASAGTLGHPSLRECRQLRVLGPGRSVRIGEFEVLPFRVPHDAAEPIGFRLEGSRGSMALVTDLGHVPAEIRAYLCDLDLLVLEANHDPAMLWNGPYPPRLKRRIAGELGHLSNQAAAAAVAACGARAPGTLWLAHLSAVNNSPARALAQVATKLRAAGLEHLGLWAVPRHGSSLRWPAVPRQLALF